MRIAIFTYNRFRQIISTFAIGCLLFNAGHVLAQPVIITTCAGTGADGNSGDGGTAVAARLSGPAFVTTDAANNLYISDYAANVVRKVNSAGIISTVAGNGTSGYSGDGGPATNAMLQVPAGVAVDDAGNLYISDQLNNIVRKVDPSGTITAFAGTGVLGYSGDGGPATAANISQPTDIVTDHSGNVYFSDYGNSVIRKVDPSGIITNIAGVPLDWGYTGTGGPATNAKIVNVFGMGIDNSGNIYIAESRGSSHIRKISPMGIITLVAGDDSGDALINGAMATAVYIDELADVAIGAEGEVYFSKTYSAKVWKIGTDGRLFTFAGNGYFGFGGDGGSPVFATLKEPIGLAVDMAGSLYIADASNNRIRKVGKPTLGIAGQTDQRQLTLFPNPSKGTFSISGLPVYGSVTCTFRDIAGRVLYAYEVFKNNPEDLLIVNAGPLLHSGTYMLHISCGEVNRDFLFFKID